MFSQKPRLEMHAKNQEMFYKLRLSLIFLMFGIF